MDAALITRMFNFGCNVKKEPPKDVLAKKNSDFKDVLSKNVKDVKNEDSKVSKDVNKEDKEKNFSVGESMLRSLMESFLYNEVIDKQLKGHSKNQTMKSFGATDDMTIEELAEQIIESSFEKL